jgi:hypothetical protein
MEFRIIAAVAGERMPTGVFARVVDGVAYVDAELAGVGGIVRHVPGPRREWHDPGEPIDVLTDGGALAHLVADAEIAVRGTRVRLVATQPTYLHVSGGRVVGFGGDHLMGR